MTQSKKKIGQYLGEAQAMEMGLVRDLEAQIAMTPKGAYRNALQEHLKQTREHARKVQSRIREVGGGRGVDPVGAAVGVAESVVSQTLALSKAPLALLRGQSTEEKVLKSAKEACASEALEIATYTAIEQLAEAVGDERTAKLAVEIRRDEEKMLERVLSELPRLCGAVVAVEVRPHDGVPGGEPWPGYDEQTVDEIRKALSEAGERRVKEVRSYERSHKRRSGVIEATEHESPRAA